MERISGPYEGFYIASYASESGGPSPAFHAYAKICRGKPDNYWDAHCCAKIASDKLHPTPHAAIAAAEDLARTEAQRFRRFAFAQPTQTGRHG